MDTALSVCMGSLSQSLSDAVKSNALTPLITGPGSALRLHVGWHFVSVCETLCGRGGSVYPVHKQWLAAGRERLAMIGQCEMWLTEAARCPFDCNL